MTPFLLDTLTIIFIVGSLALLWVNLRGLFRRTARRVPLERGAVPVNGDAAAVTFNEVAEASDAEIAACSARAGECLEQAEQSTSETDREAWLLMAQKWIKLGEQAKRRGNGFV